jgi:hypothetical protein
VSSCGMKIYDRAVGMDNATGGHGRRSALRRCCGCDGDDQDHHMAILRDGKVEASPFTRGRVILTGGPPREWLAVMATHCEPCP